MSDGDRAAVTDPPRPWRISRRFLLAIYAIVPLTWAVVLVDAATLGGLVRDALPSAPEELFWFSVLFVLPHTLASQFSFYDPEYLRAYRDRLLVGVPVVLALAALLHFYDAGSDGLAFAAVTSWHSVSQQAGIAGVLMGGATRSVVWWKWLTIALYTVAVTNLAGPSLLWMGATVLLVTTLLTIQAARGAERRIGRQYLWATQAMVLSAGGFVVTGYAFFGLLLTRVVHDVTGWAFYLTHERNRNLGVRQNALYRLRAFSHVPVSVLVVVFAIGINVALDQQLGRFYHPIILAVTLFHYWSESFMWKRDTVHRREIAFSA